MRFVMRSALAGLQIRYRGNVESCGGEEGCAGGVSAGCFRAFTETLFDSYENVDRDLVRPMYGCYEILSDL